MLKNLTKKDLELTIKDLAMLLTSDRDDKTILNQLYNRIDSLDCKEINKYFNY